MRNMTRDSLEVAQNWSLNRASKQRILNIRIYYKMRGFRIGRGQILQLYLERILALLSSRKTSLTSSRTWDQITHLRWIQINKRLSIWIANRLNHWTGLILLLRLIQGILMTFLSLNSYLSQHLKAHLKS